MNKKNNNKHIAFWGSPPPPIGGMTVHIKRLSKFLKEEGWKVTFYNFNKIVQYHDEDIINVPNVLFWYLKLLFGQSANIHYIITTRPKIRFLASLFSVFKGKKIILRVGGSSFKKGLYSCIISKYFNIISLKYCSAFIGVNEEICKMALKYTKSSKIHLIPGFIPPFNDGSSAPAKVLDFFANYDIKIVVTGQICIRGEKDIYGLWDILDVIKMLKDHYHHAKLRLCIVSYSFSGDNSKERKSFLTEIENRKINGLVLLYHSTKELWPILKLSNVYIRPSYTDGDANSIREAIHFNNIVVASDCINRPKGCLLYKTGNKKDLLRCILEAMKKTNQSSQRFSPKPDYSNLKKTLNMLNILNQEK